MLLMLKATLHSISNLNLQEKVIENNALKTNTLNSVWESFYQIIGLINNLYEVLGKALFSLKC